MQRCHVVTKERLRRLWKDAHNERSAHKHPEFAVFLPATLKDLLADDRLVVLGCERHHRLMDSRMSLRLPRSMISEYVERFCADVGLALWLEDRYGPA